MSKHVIELLEAFEDLPTGEKQLFAIDVLRRTRNLPFDSGPLSDEETGEAWRFLFALLDQEENASTNR